MKSKLSENDFYLQAIRIAIILLFLGCILSIAHVNNGIFTSEFGGHPDEPAHFVTGLMIRDYIVNLFAEGLSPIDFASEYYLHYPKVALGNWPPGFYLIQAFWFLLFPTTRLSVIVLMGCLTILLGFTIYVVTKQVTNKPIGLITASLCLMLPHVSQYSAMTMTEIPLALFTFWSAIFFYKYLESERLLHAVLFGLMSVAAIFIKGNALAIALVPPLALSFSRKFKLLRHINFWVPAAIVLLLCTPWYLLTFRISRSSWVNISPGLDYFINANVSYFLGLFHSLGWILSVLFAIGIISFFHFLFLKRKENSSRLSVMAALLIGGWLFHTIIPSSMEERHLILIIPAIMVFIGKGIHLISIRLSENLKHPYLKNMLLIVILALTVIDIRITNPNSAWVGFGDIAQGLTSRRSSDTDFILIVSDSIGEGMFIASMAMRENRPGHIIARSSKVLSSSDWLGRNYKSYFSNPDDLMAFLSEVPIRTIVVDASKHDSRNLAHFKLLSEMFAKYKEDWVLDNAYPYIRDGLYFDKSIMVYYLNKLSSVEKNAPVSNAMKLLYERQVPNVFAAQIKNPPKFFSNSGR